MPLRPTVDLRRVTSAATPVTSDPTVADDPRAVPEATVGRLPGYLHALRQIAADGVTTVSSQALAVQVGESAVKVRKDLSYLGSFGTRGVGYDVGHLVHAISMTLGVADDWEVAIAGLGNLGRALAGYVGFAHRGLRVAALFEIDPAVVGSEVAGIRVHHMDEAPEVLRLAGIRIAVIAAPAEAAQSVADRMVAGGVTSLLSFATAAIGVPPGVHVRHVDLSAELQILGFRESRRREDTESGVATRQAVSGAGR